jgi:hypothetical protein
VSLCLSKHCPMKTYGEWMYRSTFDFSTGWRWVISFMFLLLYSRERAPGTLWIQGWVGAPELVWTVWGGENSWPYQYANSESSIVRPMAIHCTNCTTTALLYHVKWFYIKEQNEFILSGVNGKVVPVFNRISTMKNAFFWDVMPPGVGC